MIARLIQTECPKINNSKSDSPVFNYRKSRKGAAVPKINNSKSDSPVFNYRKSRKGAKEAAISARVDMATMTVQTFLCFLKMFINNINFILRIF